jgi:hypothetical protein
MARSTTSRSALDRLREKPQAPVDIIPPAQGRKKRDDRTWDRAHPVISYFIPPVLHEQAKDVRSSVLALAQSHMTTITSVAIALMSFSLTKVRQGKLKIDARPNTNRRKMALVWEEAEEWPQEVPQLELRARKTQVKDVYLGYRWGRDVDAQIKSIADKTISPGEVVVFLLDYALAAYKSGRLRFKEEAIVVTQKVSPTW